MASPTVFGIPFVVVSEFSLLPLPKMTLLSAVAVTLRPITKVLLPVTVLLTPITPENSPVTLELCPKTTDELPLAVVRAPNASALYADEVAL